MIVATIIFLASLHLQTAVDLSDALRSNNTNVTFCIEGRMLHNYWPEHNLLVVQDKTGTVMTRNFRKLDSSQFYAGTIIRITGHTTMKGGHCSITVAICDDVKFVAKGIAPAIPEISLLDFNQGLYDFQHIRLNGTVKEVFRDELSPCWIYLVLSSDREFVYAAFRHVDQDDNAPFDFLGCTISIAGICNPNDGGARHHYGRMLIAENIGAVEITCRPPWWTPARQISAIIILFVSLVAAIFWNFLLHIVVEHRSRTLLREQLAHLKSELKANERTRLAVELHDSIVQCLTGATMELRTANILSETDIYSTRQHLHLATKSLDYCKEEIRNCIWDLRNLTLEEAQVADAIRKAITPHIADAKLHIRFNVSRTRLTDNTTHAILCIIRELAINAIRHGNATTIKIAGNIENNRILFSVSDNGHGFDPKSVPGMAQGHFGLQGIRDRIEVFNGKLDIKSHHSTGTKATVSLEIPQNHKMS